MSDSPIFTNSRIRGVDLRDRLTEISPKGGKGTTTLSALTAKVRRTANADITKDKQFDTRVYATRSYLIGTSTIVIPKITLVNFGSEKLAKIDLTLAALNYALANNVGASPELIKFFTATSGAGYNSLLSISNENGLKTNENDGGTANRSSADGELETAVNVVNIGSVYRNENAGFRNVALLDRVFHEFSHTLAGHYNFNDKAPLSANLTEFTSTNWTSIDGTYKLGLDFVTFIKEFAKTNPTFTIGSATYDLANLGFTDADVAKYYYGVGGKGGQLALAAEVYENTRIAGVSGKLKNYFGLLKNSAALPEALDRTTLEKLVTQKFLQLRSIPADATQEQRATWGSRLSDYERLSKNKVDYNGDGKQSYTKGGVVYDDVVSNLPEFDFEDGLKSVITGIADIDGGQLGSALGSVLGRRLTNDPFGQVIASGALSTALSFVGELIDEQIFNGVSSTNLVGAVSGSFGSALASNVAGAGVGAVSSYLTAELFEAIGVDGVAGELGQTVAGGYVNAIITNIPQLISGTTSLGEVLQGVNVATLVGSFIGSKLATEIYSPSTVGGQIGSAVGTIYGGFAASATLVALGTSAGLGSGASAALAFAAANPVAAVAIVAAIVLLDTLLGSMIGSLFGGTPRSGADVVWDPGTGQFEVANAYSRKGGSKDTAVQLSQSVADGYNAVLTSAGSTLLDAEAIRSGNFGMRKSDFVYRLPTANGKNAIAASFSDANGLITHGAYLGLSDIIAQSAGGDTYIKRGVLASLRNAAGNPGSNAAGAAGDFGLQGLLGDISVAQDYRTYLENSTAINALIAADPQSVFAAGWLVTLSRAVELELNQRASTDWTGGFGAWLDELADDKIDGRGLAPGLLAANIDPLSNARYWTIETDDSDASFFVEDTIEAADIDLIAGTGGNDDIRLTGETLQATNGAINAGLMLNGAVFNGQATRINVVATVDAGDGDDRVEGSGNGDNLLGGGGNDTLFGGRLDDWLIGGDGDDALDAGSTVATALGGDGNYLDGGDGDDTLLGREGSDWLEGGVGVDVLRGGAGGDILAGGGDDGDDLQGGADGDQYLVRRGDGVDRAEEVAANAPLAATGQAGDAISQRIEAIRAGTLRPDWTASAAGTQNGAITGGDDSISFGIGIGIGDIRLQRSTMAANGSDNDLIVMVMETVENEPGVYEEVLSGTQLQVKDWFSNPFKRIEWLKFADGNEIRIGDISSFVVGGAGNDVLVGTSGNDFVFGGAGNDKLFLLGGDDIGNGGLGDDMVAGDIGRDLLIGGLGADELIGGKGSDAITGDGGADDIYGGDDRDVLAGGRGDGDQVVGGGGDDTFKYSRGDGADIVFDDFSNNWRQVWQASSETGGTWGPGFTYNAVTDEVTGPGGIQVRKNFGTAEDPDLRWIGRFDYDSATSTLRRFDETATTLVSNNGVDTLEFDPAINIQDVILRKDGNDLVLHVATENSEASSTTAIGDNVRIKEWFSTTNPGAKSIERLAFYQTGLLNIASAQLTAGSDLGDGTDAAPIQGGAGVDWITAAAGDDVVAGGAGNDVIAGNSGSDTLKGEAGDDVIYGGAGDDLLIGGSEKDILIGGDGSDTTSYLVATRAYLGAPVGNAGTHAIGDEYYSIENLTGSSGVDRLGGDEGQNELRGKGGNDVLLGNRGDDTYIWTADSTMVHDGADIVSDTSFVVSEILNATGQLQAGYAVSWVYQGFIGAPQQHTYRLEIRQGTDLLYQYDYKYAAIRNGDAANAKPANVAWNVAGWQAAAGVVTLAGTSQVVRERIEAGVDGGSDTLELGPNISLTDLYFLRSGNDLIVRYGTAGTTASQITLKDHALTASAVETLQLNDGLTANLTSVLIANPNATGTSGNDLLAGDDVVNVLNGNAGDDVLSGKAGNDTLDGGDGDDMLEGGAGSDILRGGANTAAGTTTTAGDTVRYVRSTAAVTVDLRISTAQTGGHAAGDTLNGIENVVGSIVGNDVLTGNDGANRLFGLAGNDTLRGNGGNDVLAGDVGIDTLYGDAGEDGLSGGDGDDQLWGGADNDRLDGGDGADTLRGEAGNDILTGGLGEGADNLDGGVGDDMLSGGAGNDTLVGGDGKDQLVGEIGNDNLQGGLGDDVYAFGKDTGTDTILDADGVNTIVFDAAVDYKNIWLTRDGNDLNVGIIGAPATVRLQGFYATTGTTRVRSISTGTHSLFLTPQSSFAAPLIDAMGALSLVAPAATTATIAALAETYWHAGGKAAPVVVDQALTMDERSEPADARTLAGNVGAIDHDGNIGASGYVLVAGPANGSLTLNAATGAWIYTPETYFNGNDSFSFRVSDADNQFADQSVTVAVAPVNSHPLTLSRDGTVTEIFERDRPAPGGNRPAIDLGVLTVDDPDNRPVDALGVPLFIESSEYSFTVSDPRFEVGADQHLYLKLNETLDYETAAIVTVGVTAIDPGGLAMTVPTNFTFSILNTDDYLYGSSSANLLEGQTGRDLIYGLGANDNINSFDGDDYIEAGAGADTVNAGPGADVVSGGFGADLIGGNLGNDQVYGEGGDDTLSGGNDVDLVSGGDGNDLLFGDAGDDKDIAATVGLTEGLFGGAGDDRLIGGLGADYLDGGLNFDIASYRYTANGIDATVAVTADLGDSTLNTGAAAGDIYVSIEGLRGTPLADILRGDGLNNDLAGDGGNDTIYGRAGKDSIDGGLGNDTLYGEDGDDTLLGLSGADTLDGGLGRDSLVGGDDDDTLVGGNDADVLTGGAGNDMLRGGAGDDSYIVARGDGNDTVDQAGALVSDNDRLGFQAGTAVGKTGVVDNTHLWLFKSGNDVMISVLGTSGLDAQTKLLNFVTNDADGIANVKTVIAGQLAVVPLRVGDLADLMTAVEALGRSRPTTIAQFNTLYNDSSLMVNGQTFKARFDELWQPNQLPNITVPGTQTFDEDAHTTTAISLPLRIWDDLTLSSSIQTTIRILRTDGSGLNSSLFAVPVFGSPDINGNRTLELRTLDDASGSADVEITARDDGGRERTAVFRINVTPVADAPVVEIQQADYGLAGPDGIPLTVSVSVTDGSETITRIEVLNVPTSLSFNAGARQGSSTTWQLTVGDLEDLKLIAPIGWSPDLTGPNRLQIRATSTDVNGSTATSVPVDLEVIINAAPDAPTLQSRAPTLSELVGGAAPGTNTLIATFNMSDPDGSQPTLAIVPGSNRNNWFATDGSTLKFNPWMLKNMTSDWVRANAGKYGIDPIFNYDADGDGNKEIRIATLDVFAKDSDGLSSGSTTIDVFLEDVNELPSFVRQPTVSIGETQAPSVAITDSITSTELRMSGRDIDGSVADLRYMFWTNNALSNTSQDGRFRILDSTLGTIAYTGLGTLDYDAPINARTFTNAVKVIDRAGGAGSLSALGTLTVNVTNVNELHSMRNATFNVTENDLGTGILIPVASTNGVPIALRDAMLTDPEQANMTWQFVSGTRGDGSALTISNASGGTGNVAGPWQLGSDGTLRMIRGVDYDKLAAVYTNDIFSYNDPALARFSLTVSATDYLGRASQATLNLSIADINEAPTIGLQENWTLRDDDVLYSQSRKEILVYKDSDGIILNVKAFDAEHQGLTYQIENLQRIQKATSIGGRSGYMGSKGSIPDLAINATTGEISLSREWEGGRERGFPQGTEDVEIEYRFDLVVSDGTNVRREATLLRFMHEDEKKSLAPPVVLDLDGDGIELVALADSTANFDMDSDGVRDRTGWVAADDAILALDRDGSGAIDSISEISFVGDLPGAQSDAEGLAAFDTNQNGFLDAGDARFGEFRLWQDADQDGVSAPTELGSFEELGVEYLGLTLSLTGETPGQGSGDDNVVYATSNFIRTDGTTGTAGDVFLAYELSELEEPASASSAVQARNQNLRSRFQSFSFADGEAEVRMSGPLDDTNTGADTPRIAFSGWNDAALADGETELGEVAGVGETDESGGVSDDRKPSKSLSSPPSPQTGMQMNDRGQVDLPADPSPQSDRATPSMQSTPAPSSADSDGSPERLAEPSAQPMLTSIMAQVEQPDILAAVAALRRTRPVSLNTFRFEPTTTIGPVTRYWSTASTFGDTRAERLIAAMAAFQGGEGVGSLSSIPPADTVLAQLAPAI